MTERPLRYEAVAASLSNAIERGALRPGDRLPSVRELARRETCSVATAIEAMATLEDQGWIEVRPRSGHYVRPRRALDLLTPRIARSTAAAAKVQVTSGVEALREAMLDPEVVPLGSALLSPELLPIAALNRHLASCARELGTLGAAYDAPPGLRTLRRQIARRSVSWGAPMGEDAFVTTVGGMEALHLCLRATTRPGDTVVVESPTYFGILQLIEELGLKALEVPACPETGLDLDVLEATLKAVPVRAVIAMPTVSNPLGAVMPDDGRAKLAWLLERHDVPLIEDDVYGELVFDGARPKPVASFDSGGRVLLVGSISKTLAAGYRVGWVAPGRYMECIRRLKFATTVATPTFTQMAVAEMLASGGYDRHLRRLRGLLRGQVARMREAVAATFPKGTRVSAPRGGFVLWVELPTTVDSLELQRRSLEKKVAIAPGAIFSARGRFGHCVRLSCGFPWNAKMEASVAMVGELAHALLRPQRRSA